MGAVTFHNPILKINPKPTPDTSVSLAFAPNMLFSEGFNIPVEVSTASIFLNSSPGKKSENAVVFAHFDTGASSTSIDINLAKAMNLSSSGTQNIQTAAGIQQMPVFVVNINFPNSDLSPFVDLKVSSCKLNYDPNVPPSPHNFALLLGRDIMSRWNIVWNGPTSTVFIND